MTQYILRDKKLIKIEPGTLLTANRSTILSKSPVFYLDENDLFFYRSLDGESFIYRAEKKDSSHTWVHASEEEKRLMLTYLLLE